MKYYNEVKRFNIDGNSVSAERYGEGHINETYFVYYESKHNCYMGWVVNPQSLRQMFDSEGYEIEVERKSLT